MASSLSEEEFHRMQTQLLELRSANYTLEELTKRRQYEISLLKEKQESLEKEFQKAQKALLKSKKAKDVELLIQENDSLQLKLQSQEDEFSLQNTTLMQELSLLVSSNEKLERELKRLKDGDEYQSYEDPEEVAKLKDNLRKLQAENAALQKSFSGIKTKHVEEVTLLRESLRKMTEVSAQLESQCIKQGEAPSTQGDTRCLQQSPEDDSGMVEVGDMEVSFHKPHNSSMIELFQQMENRVETLEKELKDFEELKILYETEKEEKLLLQHQLELIKSSQKNESTNLQEEVERLKEKLTKKQESFVQLQTEKENMYEENKKAFEEMQASKDKELLQLKELTQRLQTQLNNGSQVLLENVQGFQDYRDKTNATIQELENQAVTLKSQINQQSADKLQELEAERIVLRTQLTETKALLNTATEEAKSLGTQLEEVSGRVKVFEEDQSELNKTLEDTKKVAEKRKTLLDEMAIHLQKKAEEHQQEVIRLTDEYTQKIEQLSRELDDEKTKTLELVEARSKLDDFETQLESLESTKGWFERRLNETEAALESAKSNYESLLNQQQEEFKTQSSCIKEDFLSQVKDLETQLEISNAQKVEYEETIGKLKQDAKDSIEDRKIHDKKGASIVKDLKRQLQMERKRAEKLQERLQEALNDSSQARPMEVGAFKPLCENGDRADTSSISSWSLMSGGQLDNNRDTQDGSGTGSSIQNGNSPTPPSVLEQENNDLLSRLTLIQQEKWILEEKVNHLEQSNGAMAEDLVQKQAVIQYYCMEGRADPHPHHPHFDKLTVKRVVDFIKDKGDEGQREINRKLLRTLEETLTKNMCLQKDMEMMSQEIVRVSKEVGQDCEFLTHSACMQVDCTPAEQEQ